MVQTELYTTSDPPVKSFAPLTKEQFTKLTDAKEKLASFEEALELALVEGEFEKLEKKVKA